MPTRRFYQSAAEDQGTPYGCFQPLPTDKPVAIYARQSTQRQVEQYRESGEMQTTDLIALAHRYGWADEKIILYTQDQGRSGTLRIDQREGLRALMDRIENDEVKAVLVFLEDRLFRDETGIQYNVFIDACKRHDVRVITPNWAYDFNRNRFDTRLFRDKCDQAADFIRDYVRTRLHGGQERVALRGEYDGRQIPFGLTIDTRRGSPTCGKYIPYEPHAEIVRRLFERYHELGGNFAALCREVEGMGVLFPDFTPDVDPRYRNKNNSVRVPGGYKPARDGLRSILTNVAYIGWWIYKGKVISKDNHAPIVDERLFWYAFKRLSYQTPEGEPQERPMYRIQYQHRDTAPIEALLRDVITTSTGTVRVQAAAYPSYVTYKALSSRYQPLRPYSIHVEKLDKVFVDRMFQVARHTRTGEDILAAVKEIQRVKQQQLVSVDQQLQAAERKIAGLMASLELPPDVLDAVTRGQFAKQLKEAREVQAALEEKKREVGSVTREEELAEYVDVVTNIVDRWETLPFEKRKLVIGLIVKEVRISAPAPHWLKVEIDWQMPYKDMNVGYIYRSKGHTNLWTDEEDALMREHYTTAPREDLLKMFPTRSFSALVQRAIVLGLSRTNRKRNTTGVHEELSWKDAEILWSIGETVKPETDVRAFWIPTPVTEPDTELSSVNREGLPEPIPMLEVTGFISSITAQLRSVLGAS